MAKARPKSKAYSQQAIRYHYLDASRGADTSIAGRIIDSLNSGFQIGRVEQHGAMKVLVVYVGDEEVGTIERPRRNGLVYAYTSAEDDDGTEFLTVHDAVNYLVSVHLEATDELRTKLSELEAYMEEAGLSHPVKNTIITSVMALVIAAEKGKVTHG